MNALKSTVVVMATYVFCQMLNSSAFAQFSNVINVPPDPVPEFVGADSQLNLFDGGFLPVRYSVGEAGGNNSNVELNVHGGVIGQGLTINNNSVVNVSGGTVGAGADIGQRATLNISGGTVGGFVQIGRGASLEVSGGVIGANTVVLSPSTIVFSGGEIGGFRAHGSTRVTQKGGSLGYGHRIESGSTHELSGGTLEPGFYVGGSANFVVQGGEFRLEGQLLPELSAIGSRVVYGDGPSGEFNLVDTYRITGTLADGTPFSFEGSRRVGRVILETVALPDAGPQTLDAATNTLPSGIRDGQTLIVSNGGAVPAYFRAGWGSAVLIQSGGIVEKNFQAIDATVNVTGGQIGPEFTAFNSNINISGGRFDDLAVFSGNGTLSISGGAFGDYSSLGSGRVNISGSDFRVNGTTVAGLENDGDSVDVDLPFSSTFTGIFADGTPFAFSIDDGRYEVGAVHLTKTPLAPLGPATITASRDEIPLGIRGGQTLNVDGGVVPDHFNAGPGSTVNVVSGGAVGRNFESTGATVTVTGGTIGHSFDAFRDSDVAISGGSFGDGFQAFSDSNVRITGGTFGDGFEALLNSHVTFVGSDFRLDGVPLNGLDTVGDRVTASVPLDQVLTGTFADGTPFAFKGRSRDFQGDGDSFVGGTLTLERSEISPASDLILASTDPVPLGIHEGQTLIADAGSVVPENFNAGRGSTVQIESGSVVGDNFEAYDAQVTISGGAIGRQFDAFGGTVVTMSGGTIGPKFEAYAGSELHLIGEAFLLNGAPIDGLENSGDSIVLDTRDQYLTGTLQDGSYLAFWPGSFPDSPDPDYNYFDLDATLRVSLSDDEALNCDFNDNGLCELDDIDSLLRAISTNDVNYDLDASGTVDTADIAAWLTSAGNENIGRPYLSGDASLDGQVDATDLNRVGQNWQEEASSWGKGDFNADGFVDAMDLNQVGQNWLRAAATARTTSVPEPPGTMLGVIGLVAILLIARCRRS